MANTKKRGLGRKIIRLSDEEYAERLLSSDILDKHEDARQMIDHNPMYFITDQARVISCVSPNVRELTQYQRDKARAAQSGTAINCCKHCVDIWHNGDKQTYYVHKLVSHYFPDKSLSYFNGHGDSLTHHIDNYDPDNPQESNRPERLERLDDRGLHTFMHSLKPDVIKSSQAIKQIKTMAKHTNKDVYATVIEGANKDGKGAKAYTANSLEDALRVLDGMQILQFTAVNAPGDADIDWDEIMAALKIMEQDQEDGQVAE